MALQVFHKALRLNHGITTEKYQNLYPSVNQQGLVLLRGTTTKSSRHKPAPSKNWEKCVDSSRKIHFFNYSKSGIHFLNFSNSLVVLERFFACFKSTVRTEVISKRILSLNPCKMAISHDYITVPLYKSTNQIYWSCCISEAFTGKG